MSSLEEGLLVTGLVLAIDGGVSAVEAGTLDVLGYRDWSAAGTPLRLARWPMGRR
jgi:hypothetical protein